MRSLPRLRPFLTAFAVLLLGTALASVIAGLSGPSSASGPAVTSSPSPSLTFTPPPATPAFCQGSYAGDTTSGSQLFSSYPCRPDWPETGPEHLYSFQTSVSQPVTLTLSQAAQAGLDLDVFLLVDGQPDQCFGGDASLILPLLPAGNHLVAVDGYNGSQGEYVLHLDCSEPPLATPTPTATLPVTATPTPGAPATATPTPTVTPTRQHLAYYTYLAVERRSYPPPTPQPTTIILQSGVDGYNGAADSYLNAWEISANYANVDRLMIRQTDVMSPILIFDVSRLPKDAHVVEASLSLWALSQTNSNTASVGLYQLNRDWTPSQVTWQQAAQGVAWAKPGADAVPDDRNGAPQSLQDVDATGVWRTWDVTGLVQTWASDPQSNHGVLLKALAEPKVQYALAASEYHNVEARPKLAISYWTPSLSFEVIESAPHAAPTPPSSPSSPHH